MYQLPQYHEKDEKQVLAFMQEHAFAMLIGTDAEQKPVATQVPFLFVEKEGALYLRGHIMKNTDHHIACVQNNQALVIFTGPHAYISASWYENKQQVSTWNYMSVHARGELSFLQEEELLLMLDELTAYYEQNPDSPSLYKSMPTEYIMRLSKAIISFEIKVHSIEHVFKLSQNRDEKSYRHIIEALEKGNAGAKDIALEMTKRKAQIFPHE